MTASVVRPLSWPSHTKSCDQTFLNFFISVKFLNVALPDLTLISSGLTKMQEAGVPEAAKRGRATMPWIATKAAIYAEHAY